MHPGHPGHPAHAHPSMYMPGPAHGHPMYESQQMQMQMQMQQGPGTYTISRHAYEQLARGRPVSQADVMGDVHVQAYDYAHHHRQQALAHHHSRPPHALGHSTAGESPAKPGHAGETSPPRRSSDGHAGSGSPQRVWPGRAPDTGDLQQVPSPMQQRIHVGAPPWEPGHGHPPTYPAEHMYESQAQQMQMQMQMQVPGRMASMHDVQMASHPRPEYGVDPRDPSMASRAHGHTMSAMRHPTTPPRSMGPGSHLRPIRNAQMWEPWVLKLTAKERNQVVNMYNLTDAEATHLKKAARRTKQRESQKRYVLRKRQEPSENADANAGKDHSRGQEPSENTDANAGKDHSRGQDDEDQGTSDSTAPEARKRPRVVAKAAEPPAPTTVRTNSTTSTAATQDDASSNGDSPTDDDAAPGTAGRTQAAETA